MTAMPAEKNPTSPSPSVSLPALEAERALLGAVLYDSHAALPMILEQRLKPADFFHPPHAEIFASMLNLYETGSAVDTVTLMKILESRGSLAGVGGATYLSELMDNFGIPANAAQYAGLIIERAIVRRLQIIANDLGEKCRSNPASVTELLEQTESAIFKVRDERDSNRLVQIHEEMDRVFSGISKRRDLQGGLAGIPSGFKWLDYKTGGFQRTDLIILAARPGVGKTSLALNFAINAAIPALRQEHKNLPSCNVAVFSLEMSTDQLLQRLLCQVGRHDLLSLRTGRLSDDEMVRIANTSSILRQAPIFVDDTGALRPLELKAKARRLQSLLRSRGQELDMIVIDYLQLMRPNERHLNREQAISEISSSLKTLAKELNVPVLTLSQLRRIEKGTEPDLSDLRESGAIEQDADMVLFISRAKPSDDDAKHAEGQAILKIKKHRNGPIGQIYLMFVKERTSFEPSSTYQTFEETS
jgi:replicative DNA helicase